MQLLPSTARMYARKLNLQVFVASADRPGIEHPDGHGVSRRQDQGIRRPAPGARELQRRRARGAPLAERAAGARDRRVHRRHPVPGNADLREEDPRDGRRLPSSVRRRRQGRRRSRRVRKPTVPSMSAPAKKATPARRLPRRRRSSSRKASRRRRSAEFSEHPTLSMSKLTGSKKATQFTESVIREMTRLNQLYGGVNLSQGFPDFAAPAVVKEAACARHHGGREPVRRHVGHAGAARGGGARVHAPLRRAGCAGRAGHGHAAGPPKR